MLTFMARSRNRWSGTVTVTAFSSSILSNILGGLTKIVQRHYAHAKQPFSADELAKLFLEPDDRALLQGSFAKAAPRGVTWEFYTARPGEHPEYPKAPVFQWSWDNRTEGGFFVFKNNTSDQGIYTFAHDAPTDLIERYLMTTTDMMDIAARFGQVRHVIHKLNVICKTPAQMRYYLPGLIPLLELGGQQGLADELREPSVRAGTGITIPTEVNDMIQRASTTIAMGLLIEQPPNAIRLPIKYHIGSAKCSIDGSEEFDNYA
jgi:hypothetical protein